MEMMSLWDVLIKIYSGIIFQRLQTVQGKIYSWL